VRRLLVATQRVDPRHPSLAATIPKLRALAARVDELVVLADTAEPGSLPPNCRVATFGAHSRVARGARFEARLAGAAARGRLPVLAHMVPLFALLAAPIVRPLGSPLLLWYTHWNPTRALRLAERVVTTVLSVDERSFPLPTAKLRTIGHGIDLGAFDHPRESPGETLQLAALGRLSPMKRYLTLLSAVRVAVDRGADLRLEIRGPALTDEERAYRAHVEAAVSRLDLGDRVTLGDALPWSDVPDALARHDVLVNLAEAADKIVYEAAAARTLPVASAPSFAALLPPELRFPRDDAEALAKRLHAIAAMTPTARAELAESVRARVARNHSVESWADAVVDAAGLSTRR